MNPNYSKKKSSKKRTPSHNNSNRNKKRVLPTIDTSLLINRAIDEPEEVFTPSRTFDQMPIHSRLRDNLSRRGFTYPTQIQHETLELLQSERDLVGIAATGTGKTAAFLVPIIDRLLKGDKAFRSLVVVPTRELALQIEKEFKGMIGGLPIHSVCLIGGTNVQKDIKRCKKDHHLIIGTPGRLIDLRNQKALRMDNISVLVLDEFDRMLDMGFINDVKKILGEMRSRQQTMMFSATVDKTQSALISQIMNDPAEVKVSSGTTASDRVDQDIVRVNNGENKFELLLDMMADQEFEKVLVFAETKHLVRKISDKLNRGGVKADQIHGNKSQHYRANALEKFKQGQVQVLVATDVAARGIDVSNVTHVINYQVPQTMDSYVHRIGRTGRAGKTGKAITFVG